MNIVAEQRDFVRVPRSRKSATVCGLFVLLCFLLNPLGLELLILLPRIADVHDYACPDPPVFL